MKKAKQFPGFLLPAIFIISIAGCGNNTDLTEAQSEVAGYCVTILLLADDWKMLQLGSNIVAHVDERGFNKAGFEAGVKRATAVMDANGWTDGQATQSHDSQISECRSVMSW